MSLNWVLMSFDRARWDAIFGGGMPGAEQMILDAMLWDNDGYFDGSDELGPGPNREQVASKQGQEARPLAAHLAHKGFTYDGLDAAQAVLLDNFGGYLGSIERLGPELQARIMAAWFWCMGRSFQNSCVASGVFASGRYGFCRTYLLRSDRAYRSNTCRCWKRVDAMAPSPSR